MQSRAAGRARWMVAIAAVVLGVAVLLQWWQVGGGPGELPAVSGNGFGGPAGGAGLAVFLVAVATLMLLALPYASETPVPIDRPVSYLLLLLVGLVGYAYRAVDLFQSSLLPVDSLTQGPGFWLAGIALLVLARGVFELHEARRPR